MAGSGDTVKVIGHFQAAVIDDVVHPSRTTVAHGRTTGSRKIVGVDMVGIDILRRQQSRGALLQARQRQTFGGINARCAQDAHRHPLAPPPGTQGGFSIDPAPGARTVRGARAGFIDPGAAAIAIDAGGANVDQAAW